MSRASAWAKCREKAERDFRDADDNRPRDCPSVFSSLGWFVYGVADDGSPLMKFGESSAAISLKNLPHRRLQIPRDRS